MQNKKIGKLEKQQILHLLFLTGLLPDSRKYIYKQFIYNSLIFKNDFSLLEKILLNINSLVSFESPDCYLKLPNGDILIIEVFCFDSSISSFRKGSNAIARKKQIIKNSFGKESYTEKYNTKQSLTYYQNSIKSIFAKHYSQVDNYIENITKKENITKDKIKVCFFIIEDTPCGCLYFNKDLNDFFYYMPLYDKEFVNLLENSQKVDYVFTCHNENWRKSIRFINNTKENISHIKKNLVKDISNKQFYTWDASLKIN